MKTPAPIFLRFTKWLVLASLLLSLCSIITVQRGWGEVYPFFFWKLYTQPLGNHHRMEEYRIYAKHEGDANFQRIPVQARFTFSPDEYVYTFSRLMRNYEAYPTAYNRQRVFDFAKHVEPNYMQYKVVKEGYQPLELYANPNKYDTATAITF